MTSISPNQVIRDEEIQGDSGPIQAEPAVDSTPKNAFNEKPNGNLVFNVLFWGIYFLYDWLSVSAMQGDYPRYFISACVTVPIIGLGALLTVHVYVNKLYLRNQKNWFWIATIGTMLVLFIARRSFHYYYTYPRYWKEGLNFPFFYPPKVIIDIVNMYLIIGLYSLFYFIKSYYEQQKLTQYLQQAKVQSELELLKLQVQPHFIFNTLNNIYSFSLQNNPKTPDLIHRLSSFLSHNLYDAKSSFVPLSKEIDYLQNYIELEKIRFGKQLDVSLNILSSIQHFQISPMLLLPLVENAFKHGAGKVASMAWIRIDISAKQDWITVKIENNCPFQPEPTASEQAGIGLENVRKRLAFLYPERHELTVLAETNTFFVILKVKNGGTDQDQVYSG